MTEEEREAMRAMMTRDRAERFAERNARMAQSEQPEPPAPKEKSYALRIAELPEAQNRMAAAMALAQANTEQSLPVESARALLRGLPTETEEPKADIMSPQSKDAQAMFRRRLQIRMAALQTNADRGSEHARVELKKLRYACSVVEHSGTSWGIALTTAGLDARATITNILGDAA